ncbi:MAG: helix-turn-helix domain-containing protein [Gammaproteobacteria bacterium]|nr:helix-turn-helix domain-containing protein [Gammaproteobacteria bacterium]
MPKTDDFFLYLPDSASRAQPQTEADPNEAQAMDLIRSAGQESIYDRSFMIAKLGELLRFARKEQELTQQGAAYSGELSQAHISRLENGQAVNGPTFESLVAYLNGIGFDVELVLRFKDSGAEFARLGSIDQRRKDSLRKMRSRFDHKMGWQRQQRAQQDDESEA